MTVQAEVSAPPGERIGVPQPGDVITCEAFANGWRRRDQAHHPTWVTDMADPWPNNDVVECLIDAERADARFVVEDVRPSNSSVSWTSIRSVGYGGEFQAEDRKQHHAQRVVARRLKPDGSYDPEGEHICFELWGNGPGDRFCEATRRIRESSGYDSYKKCSILDAPIYKTRTMQRIVRFV